MVSFTGWWKKRFRTWLRTSVPLISAARASTRRPWLICLFAAITVCRYFRDRVSPPRQGVQEVERTYCPLGDWLARDLLSTSRRAEESMNELSGVTPHRIRVPELVNSLYLGGTEAQVVELLRSLRPPLDFRVSALHLPR